MASIQQSINQLTSGTLGAVTATSLLYTQTPMYKARTLKQEAERLMRASSKGRTPEQRETRRESYEKTVQAAKLNPTEENIKAAAKAEKALKKSESAEKFLVSEEQEAAETQAREQASIEREKAFQQEQEAQRAKEKQEQAAIEKEQELASQTIRETIMRGGYEDAKSKQTMEFHKSLELLRQQKGVK